MSDKKFYIIAVALLIIAITFSYKYEEGEASNGGNSLNYFQKMNYILRVVDNVYVDEPDIDKVMEGAIEGMLKTLDPHSSYISAKDVKAMNEPLEGNFEGVGVEFAIIRDTLTVSSTISGGPSERVGVRAGDKIVAIDGPAGAGKSSVSRRVAFALGFAFLDTGAMYRAATWRALGQGVALDDPDALTKCACDMNLELEESDTGLRVRVDGVEVTDAIRTMEVTRSIYRLDQVSGARR